MKIIKGLLASAVIAGVLWLILFKTWLFFCITFGLFTFSGFSWWIFRYISGKHVWLFKSILFMIIMFISIGGFYFQWDIAAMFTGRLLALLMVSLPFIILFFAYQEKKQLR